MEKRHEGVKAKGRSERKVSFERTADIKRISEKMLVFHPNPVNLNVDENTLCAIRINHYYHLSNSVGITFAIFPPVRRALPVTIQ